MDANRRGAIRHEQKPETYDALMLLHVHGSFAYRLRQ